MLHTDTPCRPFDIAVAAGRSITVSFPSRDIAVFARLLCFRDRFWNLPRERIGDYQGPRHGDFQGNACKLGHFFAAYFLASFLPFVKQIADLVDSRHTRATFRTLFSLSQDFARLLEGAESRTVWAEILAAFGLGMGMGDVDLNVDCGKEDGVEKGC